jgi:hypothetical protein
MTDTEMKIGVGLAMAAIVLSILSIILMVLT